MMLLNLSLNLLNAYKILTHIIFFLLQAEQKKIRAGMMYTICFIKTLSTNNICIIQCNFYYQSSNHLSVTRITWKLGSMQLCFFAFLTQ